MQQDSRSGETDALPLHQLNDFLHEMNFLKD
jgi:hypothetical protein